MDLRTRVVMLMGGGAVLAAQAPEPVFDVVSTLIIASHGMVAWVVAPP